MSSSLTWSQTYNSSHTIHFPQEIHENIQRTIVIGKDYVLIKSYMEKTNVNNQAWKIQRSWVDATTRYYHLISLEETHSIQLHVKEQNPQYIEVYQPIQDDSIKLLHLVLENFK